MKPGILFEDVHLIVIDKPAGLLSQGEKTGDENLVDWLRAYLGRNYVGLVHRLDRNTSGIMVVAKRTKAAQRLTQALQDGRLHRSYLAWLVGTLPAPARWSHRLEKNERTNLVRVVKKGDQAYDRAKEAVLDVKPVETGVWQGHPLTLAELVLETGRSHQIRVQAAAEGLPLLGDRKYGRELGFTRVALHSHRLTFPHPMSGEEMSFEAPLPQDLRIQPLR